MSGLVQDLMLPVRAIRWRHVPLLMIYFAYGCSSFTSIGESFFVKEELSMTAHALTVLSVWLFLPWNIKMVFGQMVDSWPIFGSPRKSYVYVAAILLAIGALLMTGIALKHPILLNHASADTWYVVASLFNVVGLVLQDVVADAMSVELVEREGRSQEAVEQELSMIQLLGRIAMSTGMFIVAGLGGWLAHVLTYSQLFLSSLVIPVMSISGCLFVKINIPPAKPVISKILYGGIAYAGLCIMLGISDWGYAQETVLLLSMVVLYVMLRELLPMLSDEDRQLIISASIVLFVFRATPAVGPGLQWFYIDELGFDKAFFGTLAQIGVGLSLLGMWLFAKWITSRSIGWIVVWLTVISTLLSLPMLGLYYGLHEWTQAHFGFGARTIALVDTALASPFAQLSMIPMLALIARCAPAGNTATWFTLLTSLMNLSLTVGALGTKYLNAAYVVTREVYDGDVLVSAADYTQLGHLLVIVTLLGFVLPILAVWRCRV